jgi:hypothetical protein
VCVCEWDGSSLNNIREAECHGVRGQGRNQCLLWVEALLHFRSWWFVGAVNAVRGSVCSALFPLFLFVVFVKLRWCVTCHFFFKGRK